LAVVGAAAVPQAQSTGPEISNRVDKVARIPSL
jgi:hypothetical protein